MLLCIILKFKISYKWIIFKKKSNKKNQIKPIWVSPKKFNISHLNPIFNFSKKAKNINKKNQKNLNSNKKK